MMKRKAHLPQPEAPRHERSLAPSLVADMPAQRNPAEVDAKAYHRQHQLGMAKFWAAKAESLAEPFQPTGHARNPLPLRYDGVVKQGQPMKMGKYERTENHTPLSNDAIANILNECKPDCPKAQAWIKANEASKKARKRMEAQMEEREGMRKKVLQKLRIKTLEALKEAGASKEEVHEILSKLPPKDEEQEKEEPEKKELVRRGFERPGIDPQINYLEDDAQMIRVKYSSARLQNLIMNDDASGSPLTRINDNYLIHPEE